jgi:hypothetical protein
VFRHQQNASMNDSSGDGNLKGFYSYKNTFDKDSVWLSIPKDGIFSSLQISCGLGADRVLFLAI